MVAPALSGKTAIVTGGGSGIGLAISKYLASVSSPTSSIAVLDINASSGPGVLSSLRSEFPSVKFLFKKCNIADWDEQAAVFEEIWKETGSIDVVFANAGMTEPTKFLDTAGEEGAPKKPSMLTLDVNLTGTLYTVHLAVHYMRKNAGPHKGLIVCTASNAGIYPFPVAPLYAVSKHGVVGAVRSLARPLEPEGIQINALAPAVIQTGLADANLFKNMILTPVSSATNAVEAFLKDPKLTGIIAEIHGENPGFTFRAPPEYVDEDTGKNLETFWTLQYA